MSALMRTGICRRDGASGARRYSSSVLLCKLGLCMPDTHMGPIKGIWLLEMVFLIRTICDSVVPCHRMSCDRIGSMCDKPSP
jgi:hypothetical protein